MVNFSLLLWVQDFMVSRDVLKVEHIMVLWKHLENLSFFWHGVGLKASLQIETIGLVLFSLSLSLRTCLHIGSSRGFALSVHRD